MVGERVSHYRIVELIGRGSMGTVYRAEDTLLRRPVALKFLSAELTDDPVAVARFLREARAVSTLDHTNVCTVHEIGRTDDGRHFIVMPFYEGETLKSILARGPLEPVEALGYAIQIAEGLAHAERAGVVHRDIKPANILVTPRGRVKVVDFGLALLQTGHSLTGDGVGVGTAAYMSPEQVQGGAVDHRSDLWSLGVVLQEMLTGETPFRGETIPALLYAIVHTDPAPAVRNGKAVPDACAAILASCLDKDPSRRPGSAAALRARLGAALGELAPRRAGDGSPPHRSPGGRRFGRRAALASAGLVVVLAVVLSPLRERLQGLVGLGPGEALACAVLPFASANGDSATQLLADGLAAVIADRLEDFTRGGSGAWTVPPWILGYRGVATAEDARLKLGVDRTLRGTLRRSGDDLELTLLGFDAGTGRPDSRELRDGIANLETWQQTAPLAAAALLGLHPPGAVGRPETRGCTTVPAAFMEYLRGRGLMHPRRAATDPRGAAEAFGNAIAADSSFARAHAWLGRALWAGAGQRDSTTAMAAAAHLRRAAALDTAAARPYAVLGDIQARWGAPAEAAASYERCLAAAPGDIGVLNRLAELHLRAGDPAAAEAAYRKMTAARPGCVSALNFLGAFYFRTARYEEAAECFREVVRRTPGHYVGYDHLGGMYFELGRYDEARRNFENSLALEPGYVAYNNLGSLYFYSRRFGDAAAMFERALDEYADDYTVWGNLAEAYYWAPGLRDSATAAFARAVALAREQQVDAPGDTYLLSNIASYLGRLDRREEAAALLARIAAGPEPTAETLLNMADTYEQIGDRDNALARLEAALAAGLSLEKVEFYPGLRELRADPRFREVVRRGAG